MKLLALLRFRDEAERLAGYFANVDPHVDGIVALDSGSADESADLAAREPKLVELVSRPRGAPYDEGLERRLLTEAAIECGGDWLLGVDADERLERSFGKHVRARIADDHGSGHDAYSLPFCELWDRPDRFRVDGVWGEKAKTALFRASEEHRFDDRPFHPQWASRSGPPYGRHPRIDARIYHLGMLEREDRLRRQARYRELDPDERWQRIGYDYLTDETGLEVQRIEPGRDYEEVIGAERWGARASAAGLERLGDVRRMILHHTAIRDPGVERGELAAECAYMRRIERLHLDRGWEAIGYHFVVMPSGRVFAGRPVWALGAHAAAHNREAVGVALAGNFEQESPAPAAIRSLDALAARLATPPEPLPLLPHGDLMETACPGRFLHEAVAPWDEGIRARSVGGAQGLGGAP